MPDLPLLFFPQKRRVLPVPRRGGAKRLHLPTPERQRDRLQPQFKELERIFEAKRVYLQDNPVGLLPEQALVLETVNPIEDFFKALRGLHELDWIGEYEVEDIEPDEDFVDPKNRDAKLPGRLYLVLHNQVGLQQLLSLWKKFESNPEDPQFRRGRAKFGHLFRQLKTIRPWNHGDRLQETGVLEEWQERAHAGQEIMRIEVELWPRRQPGQRKRIEQWIEKLAQREQGKILAARDSVTEYAYHGMLLELPIQSVQRILEDPNVDLAHCEQIMFFRPTGQVAAPRPADDPPGTGVPPQVPPPPVEEPVAALLDGLPLEGHDWLKGRLIVDDPDQWEGEYPVSNRLHGTAMASLILHGELDAPGAPLSRPLYVRPVMKPHLSFRPEECIPEDVLLVDLIHRAVDRILNRDGDEPPVAPAVRIINLSLGDPWRPFDRFPSPWVRLLDYLAIRYNVLFVASAGNHPREIQFEIPPQKLPDLLSDPERLQHESIQAVYRDTRLRRLLSPAEAINVLTVGALHSDRSQGSPAGGIDPLDGADLPSLYSAHGLGFRHSVKPEILFPGGRLLFREAYGNPRGALEPINSSREPGQKVAAPGTRPGDLNSVRYLRGTSNAAALVTRVACQLYDMLLELRAEAGESGLPDENLAVLMKALLVHGASWGEHRLEILKSHLGGSRAKTPAARLLGYGCLEPERILACTDQRLTLLGCGSIDAGGAYAYRLPLPPSLNGNPVWRRMITTLAWFSPINSRHHLYRNANLWLTPYGEGRRRKEPDGANALLGLQRVQIAHQETRRGTVQHEVWAGKQVTAYEEGASLTLQVNCAEDAGVFPRPVRYGLAVTLEVAESTGLPIYEEVKARIQPQIRPEIRP